MTTAPSAAPQTEQTLVDNPFGTVTNRRVVYFGDKHWLRGGFREDIPLRHVTSVSLDISRSVLTGLVLALLGFGLLSFGRLGLSAFGLLLLVLATVLLWGSPVVVINTSGRDISAATGLPWQRPQAHAFVDALRGQLFKS